MMLCEESRSDSDQVNRELKDFIKYIFKHFFICSWANNIFFHEKALKKVYVIS